MIKTILACMFSDLISRLCRALKTSVCRHEFKNEDLSLTGIPALPKPARGDSYAAGEAYFAAIDTHPSVTHRVQWPCAKCRKTFFAHSGLDILAGHRTSVLPTVSRSNQTTRT